MPVVARNSSSDLMNQMRAATEAARRRLLPTRKYSSTHEFEKWLAQVSPSYIWNWPHQQFLYKHLNRVTRGECKRLMIFMPPRHTKSETVTVRYSAFRIEKDPTLRVILGAYNQKVARKFSRKTRRIIESRLALSADLKSVDEWDMPEGGGVLAAGVKAGVTSYGGNLIVIDDPVKSREEAESESYRDKCFDWYTDDLYTRLEPNGAIVLIQTRWHPDDLAGRLLEEAANGGEQWDVVSLPALAEDRDPLGRAVGEALCPERYDENALRRIQTKLGAQSFAALYQQRPIPAEGGTFKRDWFDIVKGAPANLKWYRYWDLALSTKAKASRTASAAVALAPDGTLYIRDLIYGRWEWPDAKKKIIDCMVDEPKTIHGIEEKMHGLAAVQELRRERRVAHIPIYGQGVDRDKIARAAGWSSRAESGKVALVSGRWVADFLSEVCEFPFGKHDDIVDTVSGGVLMIATRSGVVEHGEDLW
jgi:predicted phage terminase large subunit-like protein